MATFCLHVSGDFACFTRPEMKVEKTSYNVITPSAARSIFEAILWKPAIRWRVNRIEVLKPLHWINLRRNEVSAVASIANIKQAMNAGRGQLAIYIEDERQQRAGYFLRDVAYRIHADLSLAPHSSESLIKYTEMFTRRAQKGQCVNQPYLGCREFAADFRLVDLNDSNEFNQYPPIEESQNFGWMLHDLDFKNPNDPQPRFYQAQMKNGVIDVPPFEEAKA